MKPESTDRALRQAQRRRSALWSAVISTLMCLLSAGALIWLRASLDPAGFFAKLLLLIIAFDLGSIPIIWINLKTRLKEIQGGEEDAAAQY